MSISFAIVGAFGRLGSRILERVTASVGAENVYPFGRADTLDFENVDVVIDVALPVGTAELCDALSRHPKPLVTGVTGRSEKQRDQILELGSHMPVLLATNFSVGAHAAALALEFVAARLGPEYQTEIVEIHHQHKQDSPSGTAMTFGEAVARGRRQSFDAIVSRADRTRRESSEEIGISSLRGGAVIGEHSVRFLGPEDELCLIHRAQTRDVFARGAVEVAEWLIDQQPNVYCMRDFVNSKAQF